MITWKMIPEIEKAFGFSLYDWQKDYLLSDGLDNIPWEVEIGRSNGRTFAYCVKLLLSDGEPINPKLSELERYTDEFHGIYYRLWFARYLLEINDTLKKAGFETRIRR